MIRTSSVPAINVLTSAELNNINNEFNGAILKYEQANGQSSSLKEQTLLNNLSRIPARFPSSWNAFVKSYSINKFMNVFQFTIRLSPEATGAVVDAACGAMPTMALQHRLATQFIEAIKSENIDACKAFAKRFKSLSPHLFLVFVRVASQLNKESVVTEMLRATQSAPTLEEVKEKVAHEQAQLTAPQLALRKRQFMSLVMQRISATVMKKTGIKVVLQGLPLLEAMQKLSDIVQSSTLSLDEKKLFTRDIAFIPTILSIRALLDNPQECQRFLKIVDGLYRRSLHEQGVSQSERGATEFIRSHEVAWPQIKTIKAEEQKQNDLEVQVLRRLMLEMENKEGINVITDPNFSPVPQFANFIPGPIANAIVGQGHLFEEHPLYGNFLHGILSHRLQFLIAELAYWEGKVVIPATHSFKELLEVFVSEGLFSEGKFPIWTEVLDGYTADTPLDHVTYSSPFYLHSCVLAGATDTPSLSRGFRSLYENQCDLIQHADPVIGPKSLIAGADAFLHIFQGPQNVDMNDVFHPYKESDCKAIPASDSEGAGVVLYRPALALEATPMSASVNKIIEDLYQGQPYIERRSDLPKGTVIDFDLKIPAYGVAQEGKGMTHIDDAALRKTSKLRVRSRDNMVPEAAASTMLKTPTLPPYNVETPYLNASSALHGLKYVSSFFIARGSLVWGLARLGVVCTRPFALGLGVVGIAGLWVIDKLRERYKHSSYDAIKAKPEALTPEEKSAFEIGEQSINTTGYLASFGSRAAYMYPQAYYAGLKTAELDEDKCAKVNPTP